eukprot:jgi/Tetstr1/456171/TSEL_042939.t1
MLVPPSPPKLWLGTVPAPPRLGIPGRGTLACAPHRPRPVARTRCNAVRSQRWEVRSQPQSASESQRRPDLVQRIGQTACVLALGASMAVPGATARMEGSTHQEQVTDLEKDTGIKLRVLAQNYPETPGLAIKDYWGVDEDTVVFVADPNTGNILNFNVGSNVDLQNFWTRLASKFGNKFFWQEQGEASSILNAVSAVPGPSVLQEHCVRIFAICSTSTGWASLSPGPTLQNTPY